VSVFNAGEGERERRALAGFGSDGDRTAEFGHQILADVEAETDAAAVELRFVALRGEEGLENLVDIVPVETGP
jgi:hypothetical protein